jgi:hypothetical protein
MLENKQELMGQADESGLHGFGGRAGGPGPGFLFPGKEINAARLLPFVPGGKVDAGPISER